jgi:hypothetical protein
MRREFLALAANALPDIENPSKFSGALEVAPISDRRYLLSADR